MDSQAIEEVHSAYPETEFALQISSHNDYFDDLRRWRRFTLEAGVPMAIHLHSPFAKEAVGHQLMQAGVLERCEGFGRVQISGRIYDYDQQIIDFAERVACSKVVLADDSANGDLLEHPKVEYLFNLPDGTNWQSSDLQPPADREGRFGYAGNFDISNIAEILRLIEAQEHHRIWLNIESGVKDEIGRFAIDKVAQICQTVFES